MIALALCLLALTDGGLSGFRAAAGRNPAVFKYRYYRTAVLRGVATGLGALVAIGLVLGVGLLAAGDAGEQYRLLVERGRVMLRVYVPFATVVAGAFALYTIRSVDLRSLLSAGIFGPVTLVRPLVIVGGALAAGWNAPLDIALGALFAAAAILAIEPVVGHRYARSLTVLPVDRRPPP